MILTFGLSNIHYKVYTQVEHVEWLAHHINELLINLYKNIYCCTLIMLSQIEGFINEIVYLNFYFNLLMDHEL